MVTAAVTQTVNEANAVLSVTAPKFLSGAVDGTLRRRLLLTLMGRHGRIEYNQTGATLTWLVRHKEQAVQAHGAGGEYTFDENDLYLQLTIDWRGYLTTDKMQEKDMMMNNGTAAIINRYRRILPTLKQAMENNLHAEMYIDGLASGNDDRLHGVETFLADGTTVAGDLIAQQTDTYAGKSTKLQAQGGTWSSDLATPPNAAAATDWPDGSGTSDYDAISPLLVNLSSTAWNTGNTSWEVNCGRILRRTTQWLEKNGGDEATPDCYLMASDRFTDYMNFQEAKYRIAVPHELGLELGFPTTLKQDGVMIKSEFDVPTSIIYGFNINHMMLSSLDSALFGSRGPWYDIKTSANLFKCGFFGNVRYDTKYFAKIKAYA